MNLENRTGKRWSLATLISLGLTLLLVGVAVASEAAHGGGHEGLSPAKITDFTWRTVNFLVFAGLLIKLVAKTANIKASSPSVPRKSPRPWKTWRTRRRRRPRP